MAEQRNRSLTVTISNAFSMVAFNGERSEIVAWDDEDVLSKFLETGNQKVT
jgi:hypothetical protein